MNRIKSLMEYVTLFRTNQLVLKKRKQLKTKNENLSDTVKNHGNESEILNTAVDYNRNCKIENIDDYENECKNEIDDGNEESENENESNSLDQNSVVRIFSWNGNQDLNVSLLPDLPLFPYKSEHDNNGMYECILLV